MTMSLMASCNGHCPRGSTLGEIACDGHRPSGACEKQRSNGDSAMAMKSFISLCVAACTATLALAACSNLAVRVAANPDASLTSPQGVPDPTWDYENRINPATNLRTAGPYDLEDLYRDPEG